MKGGWHRRKAMTGGFLRNSPHPFGVPLIRPSVRTGAPSPRGRRIKIPRPSRGFFIDGYNPLILAYTSRRVSTICQPRRFCYLLPVNGFKSSPSSTVLQLCLHLAGGGYTLLFSLHFCLPYLHSILGTKIPDFGTYIATLDTSHKSSGYFSLSDIP